MVEIENKKLHDLIVEKDRLVDIGRGITRDIVALENKAKVFEMKEKRITAKVVPAKEMTDRGDELVKQVTALNVELEKLARKINDSKLDAIPGDMKKDHLELLKKIEGLERDRNKVALKVQKIKDKVIPIIQKEVKPLLGEYDDIETAKTKDGKVMVETFNHLVEFKKKFNK
jgi:hypothetical protein